MNAPLMQRCGHCGQEWWGNHYCPSLNAAVPRFGNTPLRMLTEEDVRRIVREEIAQAMALHLLRPHADPGDPILAGHTLKGQP